MLNVTRSYLEKKTILTTKSTPSRALTTCAILTRTIKNFSLLSFSRVPLLHQYKSTKRACVHQLINVVFSQKIVTEKQKSTFIVKFATFIFRFQDTFAICSRCITPML